MPSMRHPCGEQWGHLLSCLCGQYPILHPPGAYVHEGSFFCHLFRRGTIRWALICASCNLSMPV